jgi:uracil-DNA glycosylase
MTNTSKEAQPTGNSFSCWDDLSYWQSGEWQVVQERLDDIEKEGFLFNPKRELMFAALEATPFDKVKVVIYGQDPYPDRNFASGLAFSIPNGSCPKGLALPPTLDSIFLEYVSDLHHPYPIRTELLGWAGQGVLLWNAIPSCEWRKSMSHDWPEWALLTQEITQRLSDDRSNIVFAFLGGVARRYVKYVKEDLGNTVLEFSHPIPRASLRSTQPFRGSRLFSRINAALVQKHGTDPIDWKL